MKAAILARYDPREYTAGTEVFAQGLIPALAAHPEIEQLEVMWEAGGMMADPGNGRLRIHGLKVPTFPFLGSGVYVSKVLYHTPGLMDQPLDFILALGTIPALAYLVPKRKHRPLLITYAIDSILVEFRERSKVVREEGSRNFQTARYLPFLLAEHAAVGRSDLLITSCQRTATDLQREYGLPNEKFRTAYLGIREDFGKGIPSGIPDIPTFLLVATDHRRRGTFYLLHAAKEVKAKGRNFRVLIVGRHDPFYERLATDLDLHAQVEFLGRLPWEELLRAYAGCSALVLPEVSTGFSLPVIEAAMFGKPSLVSDAGGLPELVEHGVDGFVFRKGDIPGLAAAMTTLIDDPSLSAKMGKNALKKAQDFTLGVRVPALVRILEEAVQGGPT